MKFNILASIVLVATEFMLGSIAFVSSVSRRHRTHINTINYFLLNRNRVQTTISPALTTIHNHQSSLSTQKTRTGTARRRYHVHPTSSCLSAKANNDSLDATSTPGTADVGNSHSNTNETDSSREIRKERLHYHLNELGVDAEALADAAHRSVTTTDGFDARFGKSAIKAYRSYLDPKPSKMAAVKRENVDVASNRYARQIDFLAKRHRSREAEWVRHIDTSDSRRTFPLVLVLDNLRSAANVGSIYRSADACGCLEILTTGITPHPGGNGAEKLAKSALGAERIVTSQHFMTTKQALDFLREERPNLRLFGMETTERSKCYTSVKYPGPSDTAASDNNSSEKEEDQTQAAGVALFLGNEVSGVDTEIMPLLDEVVEIPMFGKKNSLNVAACAPIVMYEILRQWGVSSNV